MATEVEMNTIWEMIRENIKMSAKEGRGYYELKQHKSWFMKDANNYKIQEKKLNFSGHRIQGKKKKRII
jgi:phosphoribulokinase